MVDGLEKKLGVALDMEQAAAVVGGCGDEVGSRSGGAGGDRHSAIVSVPQRLKPLFSANCFGTAEAVPLSKTDRALRDGAPGTVFLPTLAETGIKD